MIPFMIRFDSLIRKYYYEKIFKVIKKEIKGCNSLLDLGCGYNESMKIITKSMDYSVGVDLHLPSIERSRDSDIHKYYEISDVITFLRKQQENSFDVIVTLSLIEHYVKKDGLNLISEMERVARKKVIILTPNGFVPQKPYDNNTWQEHKSGWTIKEMSVNNYKVYGFSGFKYLKGERAEFKYKPRLLFKILSYISQYFTFYFPKYAFEILYIKDVI